MNKKKKGLTNLTAWWLHAEILPFLLIDPNGQFAPFGMIFLGKLPTVSYMSRGVELRYHLDTSHPGVVDEMTDILCRIGLFWRIGSILGQLRNLQNVILK